MPIWNLNLRVSKSINKVSYHFTDRYLNCFFPCTHAIIWFSYPQRTKLYLFIHSDDLLQSQSQFGFGHWKHCLPSSLTSLPLCLSVWAKCGHQHLCLHWCLLLAARNASVDMSWEPFQIPSGLRHTYKCPFLDKTAYFQSCCCTDRKPNAVVLRSFWFLGFSIRFWDLGCTIIWTIATWMQCLCSIIVAAPLTQAVDSVRFVAVHWLTFLLCIFAGLLSLLRSLPSFLPSFRPPTLFITINFQFVFSIGHNDVHKRDLNPIDKFRAFPGFLARTLCSFYAKGDTTPTIPSTVVDSLITYSIIIGLHSQSIFQFHSHCHLQLARQVCISPLWYLQRPSLLAFPLLFVCLQICSRSCRYILFRKLFLCSKSKWLKQQFDTNFNSPFCCGVS